LLDFVSTLLFSRTHPLHLCIFISKKKKNGMEGKRIRGEGNGIGEATQRMTLRMLWILGLEG
jgi:hypothetical protein